MHFIAEDGTNEVVCGQRIPYRLVRKDTENTLIMSHLCRTYDGLITHLSRTNFW